MTEIWIHKSRRQSAWFITASRKNIKYIKNYLCFMLFQKSCCQRSSIMRMEKYNVKFFNLVTPDFSCFIFKSHRIKETSNKIAFFDSLSFLLTVFELLFPLKKHFRTLDRSAGYRLIPSPSALPRAHGPDQGAQRSLVCSNTVLRKYFFEGH